jgi:DNA-binding beta-propeller fold protein YncE
VLTILNSDFSWTEIGESLTKINEWSHSGVEVLLDGTVVVSTPGNSSLSFIETTGVVRNISCGSGVYHGIALDKLKTAPFLWLADIGVEVNEGKILGFGIQKSELTDFSPSVQVLSDVQGWRPTAIACERSINHPDGYAIWVADGYGNSLVHRLTPKGKPLTIDGTSSGLSFDCPHGIALDNRGTTPYVVVADRNNKRLIWFDYCGNFVRQLKHNLITSPSSIAVYGDLLFVTELFGGLIGINRSDNVVDVLHRSERPREGSWPNSGNPLEPRRPELLEGKLNSPHGITVSNTGQIIITEWLIGGRTISLKSN